MHWRKNNDTPAGQFPDGFDINDLREYRFGSGPAPTGSDKAVTSKDTPIPARGGRSLMSIMFGLIFIFSGPVTLLTIDFWEQVACKTFGVQCERTKIINWSREFSYDDYQGLFTRDPNQSFRFFLRGDTVQASSPQTAPEEARPADTVR